VYFSVKGTQRSILEFGAFVWLSFQIGTTATGAASKSAMLVWFLLVLLSTLSSLGCAEESCLLAIHPADPALKEDEKDDEETMCKHTQLPGPVQPREEVKGDSAKKRWLESWKSQATFNFMKEFSAVIIKKMLFGGLGDMFGALIKAFWPPRFSKEESIMKMLMEWTQNYVQMTLEKNIKDNIAGHMCTLKRQTEDVQNCTETLLQKTKKMLEEASWRRRKPDFPQTTLTECLNVLRGAKSTAWDVANKIDMSSYRGVLAGEFSAISWSLMGIWRHTYYLRRLEEGHYDEFPDFAGFKATAHKAPLSLSSLNASEWGNSQGVKNEMEKELKRLWGTAKAIKKDWEEWRLAKVKVSTRTHDVISCKADIFLTDALTDTKQVFTTEENKHDDKWELHLTDQEWQDLVLENYLKMLYIREFIPMVNTMPFLQQLIPGKEKIRPEPAGPFEKYINLPLMSAFLAGSGKPHMNSAAFHKKKWMRAPAKVKDFGRIQKMSALQDDVLTQLTFITGSGEKVVLGTEKGYQLSTRYIPKRTCGLDVGYHDAWMRRITFLNAEDQMEEWKGKNRMETATFFTGVGLCGLYRFYRPTYKAKEFGGTGDALQVQFQWDPDEEL